MSDMRDKYPVLDVLVDSVTGGCTSQEQETSHGCGFGDEPFDVDWGDPNPLEDCLKQMQVVHDNHFPSCGGSVELMFPDPADIRSVEIFMHCSGCDFDGVSNEFPRFDLDQAQAAYMALLAIHAKNSPNCHGELFFDLWKVDFEGDIRD